ncbi:MAG: DinB family protein [Holophagales bacterium]|nr:MAG: DinB family protein [Holophagales bacterium]
MEEARNPECRYLADQLERSFRGGAWHGPALVEAIDALDGASSGQRPLGSAHTIAEVIGHVGFWIEGARRRLAGEKAAALDPAEDWPHPAGKTDEDWNGAVAALEAAHRGLVAAVSALDDERLDDAVAGSDPTVRGLLFGLLQHNAYHAGQIVLLRKALEEGRQP